MISADLAVLDAADPNTANNSGTIILTARPSTAGLVAGAVTLSPATPKAGSRFAVSVHVTSGALSVRPTGIACAATVNRRRLTGQGKSARGKATCLFKTPQTAWGNVLRGTISFTASAKKITKRFAVRLG